MKRCACCKEEKALTEFHNSRGHGGKYPYCRACTAIKGAASYAKPETKARMRAYLARPEIAERESRRNAQSPRQRLNISLIKALRRRPTAAPATVGDLMALWERQGGKCALCGIRMTWREGRPTNTSLSLDRIDPRKGYIKENVRLICWALNRFKGDSSDDEMFAMAVALILNLGPQRKELGKVTAVDFTKVSA